VSAGKADRLMAAVLGRRRFLAVVAGGILTAPFSLQAQPAGKVWRIGVLLLEPEAVSPAQREALRAGFRDLGYAEGRNLTLEFRSAEGKLDRLAGVASDLVNARVDVIITASTPAARAARNATATIPVVVAAAGDLVGMGLVTILAQPGANLTGSPPWPPS
jgi:putative tryptophan/tyrosine transport system substrate-binding protein